MKEHLFNELVESIHEAGKIRRGETQPAHVTRAGQADEKASDGDSISIATTSNEAATREGR